MKRNKNVNASEKGARKFQPTNVVVAVVLVDQITKFVAVTLRDGIVKNHGSAFGIFTQQNLVFTVVSIIIVAGLLFYAYRRKGSEHNIYTRYGLLFIIGGGLSNIIDRIARGYVIDFIKIPFWPAFNIADACITLGIATILWYSFFQGKANQES